MKSSEQRQKDIPSLEQNLIKDYKHDFIHLKSFLTKVFIVFIFFAPIGYIKGLFYINNIFELMLCSVGIDYRINAEWWYVRTYITMLLTFPTINYIYLNWVNRGRLKSIITGLLLLPFLLLLRNYYSKTYLIVFGVGFISAKLKILEYLNKITENKQWVGSLILLATFIIRFIFVRDVASNSIDIIIIVPFIYSVCILIDHHPKTSSLLALIGKYSIYIWLTHTFFCYYYFQSFITASKISIIMFIQTLAVSLLTAIILSKFSILANKLLSHFLNSE